MSKKGIIIIFTLVSIFLFVNGVANFGYVSGSKFVQMGILLLCLLLIALGAKKIISYLAEEKVFVVLYCVEKKMKTTEILGVVIFMLIALATRLIAAVNLKRSVKSVEFKHSDLLFPAQKIYHDMAGIFRGMTGATLNEYEIFNIIMSMLSILFIYFIVRTMYGRSGGFAALFISSLWPAHILGVVYNDNKYFCTMLFLAVIYFFLMLRRTKLWLVFALLAGAALGVLVYMQTSMYILLLVLAVSIFIRGEEGKEKGFGENVVRRIPAITVSLVVTLLVVAGVNGKLAGDLEAVPKTVTGMNGYALLTGLNVEAIGNENQGDYDFLMANYEESNNAKDAQYVCLREAGKRFGEGKAESFNLILKKAQYMFGCGYNLEMRKDMTRSGVIYLEDAYYLLILLTTGIFAVEFLQRTHYGNINFIIVIGILTVITGSVFMFEETVQMQFGYIMTICSSAMVSILYRRRLGNSQKRIIKEQSVNR